MIKIELCGGYFIEADPLNHTLKQIRTIEKKDGSGTKEVERVCGYYNKLEHALDGFLRRYQMDVLDGFDGNFAKYVKSIEQANETAVSALKTLLEGK